MYIGGWTNAMGQDQSVGVDPTGTRLLLNVNQREKRGKREKPDTPHKPYARFDSCLALAMRWKRDG